MELSKFIEESLKEDIGRGDHTSIACIPEKAKGTAHLISKTEGILAGINITKQIIEQSNDDLQIIDYAIDGKEIKEGDKIFTIEGKLRSILTLERLILNVLQRMSGIASKTSKIIRKLNDTGVSILDTRKTTPLFRNIEKEAVRIGGGQNHRFGLYDMMMIKDNHIDIAGGIENAIKSCIERKTEQDLDIPIVVETRTIQEVKSVLNYKNEVDRIMLDNFSITNIKRAIQIIDSQIYTEASGNINENNILDYAKIGLDYISIGALTHSYQSIDMSLQVKNK
ncbi:MAG: carboxylating nicotinate-nucleotide diphosphorylase [Flavobacteriales bacterium]